MNSFNDTPRGLVADANILIDYYKSDKAILPILSRQVATLYLPSPVLDEVQQLSEKDAFDLGIVVVEPDLDQLFEAQEGDGPTSFQDRLCLVLAREEGWGILTNDKALRKACEDEGISCVWGLEAMALLVEGKCITSARAMATAKKISQINPFITDDILTRFQDRLNQ